MTRLRSGSAADIENSQPGLDRGGCFHTTREVAGGLGQTFGSGLEDAVVEFLSKEEAPRIRDAVVMGCGVMRGFDHCRQNLFFPRVSRQPSGSGIVGTMQQNWRKAPWHLRYRTGPRVMSWLRRLLIKATHLHAHIEFQGPVRLGRGFELDIPDGGTFIVGPGVDFRRGFKCEISGKGRVVIGAGSVFTADALIQCATSIEIGEGCAFGQATFICDGIHRFRDYTRHWLEQGYDYQPITIGNGVGVHTKSTIIHNIGERAIIGANSFVAKPIPAYCLAIGVPARVIEYFGPPEMRPSELGMQS
jgi:acetyltransferase-like isoleucine patch superfamily enzyme